MKNKILAMLLLTAAFSCKKSTNEPLPDPDPISKYRLLTTRTLNPNGHYILQTNTYLNNGLLKTEASTDESTGLNIIQEYFYVNGIPEYSVISNDTRKISRIDFFYSNGRMVKLTNLEYDQFGVPDLSFSRSYEYNGDLLSKITTLSDQDEPRSYEVFTFQGENVTEVKTFTPQGLLLNTTEYLYDIELNPYKGNLEKSQQAAGLSKNNVMRVRYTDYNNPAANSDRRYEYAYNPGKYPVKKFFIGPVNRELQIAYTYQEH